VQSLPSIEKLRAGLSWGAPCRASVGARAASAMAVRRLGTSSEATTRTRRTRVARASGRLPARLAPVVGNADAPARVLPGQCSGPSRLIVTGGAPSRGAATPGYRRRSPGDGALLSVAQLMCQVFALLPRCCEAKRRKEHTHIQTYNTCDPVVVVLPRCRRRAIILRGY
jgi:hypothetical protein